MAQKRKKVDQLAPPPPAPNDFQLSGTDSRTIRLKKKHERSLQTQLNREARRIAKEEKESKERAKNEKAPTVFTVTHHPTYSVLSQKRLDGLPGKRKPSASFTTKNEIQSIASQSRLKNAINWMLLFTDKKRVYSKEGRMNKKGEIQHNFSFKLAFITLTLSDDQKHDDKYIKEHMLQPFLYWLTRYYQALYVWKAETQLNGNIHFHVTIDTFVPWKSVRAKWNKILEKHGYCKTFQDGTNDKGDAATQIKSVLSESKCAKDIGGYMSKKDRLQQVLQKAFEKMASGNFKPCREYTAAANYLTYGKTKNTKEEAMKIVTDAYTSSQLHCKYDPDKKIEEQDEGWYKRVIDGRLWGCSENLSKIKIFIDETFCEFEKEETIFFRQNNDIYNLGTKVIEREKKKYAKVDIAERQVRNLTDEDIEHRYRFMQNVFIHPHLNTMKKGATLQKMIHEEKLIRKKNNQKFFTDN